MIHDFASTVARIRAILPKIADTGTGEFVATPAFAVSSRVNIEVICDCVYKPQRELEEALLELSSSKKTLFSYYKKKHVATRRKGVLSSIIKFPE